VQQQLELIDLDAIILKDLSNSVVCEVGTGEGFLLAAHLDTVPPHGDFPTPEKRDGKLHALGCSDDKASVATILEIARCLDSAMLRRRLLIVLSGREEGVPREENPIYRMEKLDAGSGLYLEPTLDGDERALVAMGSMGLLRAEIRFTGERSAAWSADTASNPIYLATEFVRRFADAAGVLSAESAEVRVAGRTQSLVPSFSVTQIYAAEGAGVVPPDCTVTIDCRLLPDDPDGSEPRRFAGVLDLVNNLFEEIQPGRTRVEGHSGVVAHSDYPGYALPKAEDRLFALCEPQLAAARFSVTPGIARGRSDAGVLLQKHGIPVVVLGPGQMNQCHKADEHILLDPFHRCASAVWEIVKTAVY